MPIASPISLALSLVFGLGQLVVGAGVARWVSVAGRWRTARLFVLLLLALWFACSGIAELFVSGMEALRRIAGWPPTSAFVLWRTRADAALLVATVVLVAALPIYAGTSYLSRRRRAVGPTGLSPHTRESDITNGELPAGGD